MLRGHHTDHDGCALDRRREIIARRNGIGDFLAGKKLVVYAPLADAPANLFFMGPQADAVILLSPKNNSQCRSPCSGADDGNLAHARLAPMRLSVPATRR